MRRRHIKPSVQRKRTMQQGSLENQGASKKQPGNYRKKSGPA